MSVNDNTANYQQLFGKLMLTHGEDARSVYSPAAYLCDLLDLLRNHFDNTKDDATTAPLSERRDDIEKITLNYANTFNEIPYLAIVNKILEQQIGEHPYIQLRNAQHPFNTPFNLQNERLKNYQQKLATHAVEIYRALAKTVDFDIVAREYLGLSQEEFQLVTTPRDIETELKPYFQLGTGEDWQRLVNLETFLERTGLNISALRELLFQNLSEIAKDPQNNVERSQAGEFFINHALGGYVTLAANVATGEAAPDSVLMWSSPSEAIPIQWFERVNRFIRLARRIEMSFTELDRVLRCCCGNQLDAAALRKIAAVKYLHTATELPLDVVCALLGQIDTLGVGEDTQPLDLFNRVFNLRWAAIDKKVIPGSLFRHRAYGAYSEWLCTNDLLAPNNKEYRMRLTRALDISESDLTLLVSRFRERYTQKNTQGLLAVTHPVDLPVLSLLFRIAKLVEATDTTYTELLALLDVIDKDPWIRQYDNFDLLIGGTPNEKDPYRILEGGDPSGLLWLVQILVSVTGWMQTNDLSSAELKQILTGQSITADEQIRAAEDNIAAFDNLYQRFQAATLRSDSFVSSRFGERASQAIERIVTDPQHGVASAIDGRLVSFDSERAVAAAYQAIAQLDVVSTQDFVGLGLESALLEKTYENLIRHGYLDERGVMDETTVPKTADGFTLATDFGPQRNDLFSIVNGLYAGALVRAGDVEVDGVSTLSSSDDEMFANGAGFNAQTQDTAGGDDSALADVTLASADLARMLGRPNADLDLAALDDVALYPDDLTPLADLTEGQRDELYDNLILNGYLSAEGSLLRPDFFTQLNNVDDFVVNADLSGIAPGIYALLRERVQKFQAQPLALDLFFAEELGMGERARLDLVENLKFNAYIDDNQRFVDKRAILALTLNDFSLSLQFFKHRQQIVLAIQEQVRRFRDEMYRIDEDVLRPVVEKARAQSVMQRLRATYLKNNRVRKEYVEFFQNRDNIESFWLGEDMSVADQTLVFDRIAGILTEVQPYRFPRDLSQILYFDEYESSELLQLLGSMGYITNELGVAQNKLSYFLNRHNRIGFSLWNFEDYNHDVFDLLQAVTVEFDAGMTEIVATLRAQADAQREVVVAALSEAIGVEVALADVLCSAVFGGADRIVESVMLPIFAAVDRNGKISTQPANKAFNLAYRRIGQFARLVGKLGISAVEAEIVLRDQDLVQKFPERLTLPNGVDRFDALLQSADGQVQVFRGNRFWTYSATTSELLVPEGQPLSALSVAFANVAKIDAAFVDTDGVSHLVTASGTFYKDAGCGQWLEKACVWGKVNSNFEKAKRIDSAFQNRDGKTYLFAGDQYIRYSGNDYTRGVDEGFPRKVAGNWENEGRNAQLPAPFKSLIDASFEGTDGRTYLFSKGQYVVSDDLGAPQDIKSHWGQLRNNFIGATQIDAGFTDGADVYMVAGDQIVAYRDCIENDKVKVKEGYPKRLESHFANLPAGFEFGLEAAFKGLDDKVYLFKNGKVVTVTPERTSAAVPTKRSWGVVVNRIQELGRVDAAFVGLDGKTYLFADDQYVRYSGSDYTRVDEGYPRLIAGDWGGLRSVDAAFVLNGKTYLFGKNAADEAVYVRYSKRDYTIHDTGYPKQPNDNWWNLPASLVGTNRTFSKIDAVFTSKDGLTYLFSGNQYITFDNKNRWWSEPQALDTKWDSIPFEQVDAAFVGTDGKTYIFGGDKYIRYSTGSYTQIDDRYPSAIKTHWGNVVNHIQKNGTIDAALVVDSRETVDGMERTTSHTYLFSGNQFFRYTGKDYRTVDNGYPKYIATSLKHEPRFKNLLDGFETGVDAAFADQRNVYLFKGSRYQVVSDALYRDYAQLGLTNPSCAVVENGALFVQEPQGWQRLSAVEGIRVERAQRSPALLRGVPENFKTGLDAILQGADNNVYLFKGSECLNVASGRAYPLSEEWGRVRNRIYSHNTIDAAFVSCDGKTYVFSGDQFVVYSGETYGLIAGDTLPKSIEGPPRGIAQHWGGLENVALAYVKDEQTFLFEKANAEGEFRYVVYSTSDYSEPDAGYPKTATSDFWDIPQAYLDQGFTEVKAVLFKGETMFLLSQEQYLQFDETSQAWSYPRPIGRIWRDFPWEDDQFPRVKTAFTGADGAVYFFSDTHYVSYSPAGLNHRETKPRRLINEFWGVSYNNFVGRKDRQRDSSGRIDAAFVCGGTLTYLFSGDQYVRYSSADYRYADEGYPKAIVGNLCKESCFKNLPAAFDEVLRARAGLGEESVLIDAVVANDRNIYLFVGGHCHVVSQHPTARFELGTLGQVRNCIVEKNRVDASFVGLKNDHGDAPTFLFCDDQYVRYSSNDYSWVDEGYPRSIQDAFAAETDAAGNKFAAVLPEPFNEGIDAAMYGADGKFYLFKGENFLTSDPTGSSVRPIRNVWGTVVNAFGTGKTITAAFVAPGGGLYAFKGNQYVRYQNPSQEYVDEGYPRSIKDNWGDLHPDFEQGIDGAFVLDSKTYLLSGHRYVRYTDTSYRRMDRIYPQAFADRWGNQADYLLTDLHTISRFKKLQDKFSGADGSLADCLTLSKTSGDIADPYDALARLFGWDVEELKWLKRCNGFLGGVHPLEQEFQLELIAKIVDVFTVSTKLGVGPFTLWDSVFRKLYPQPTDEAVRQARLLGTAPLAEEAASADPLQDAADALYRFLALSHSDQDWPVLAKQIDGELNERKRDVLLATVVARNGELSNARDVYETYLIDPETDRSGSTSYLQEAIAAVQLYVHRYLMGLEAPKPRVGDNETLRKQLGSWWTWLRNYRLWEANRKVFLYPENYIRPELRDTKTPAFKALEEDLLQGEITDASVQRAYKKYLDEYTEVSRLTIAGGYVFPAAVDTDEGRRLVLFGRTKTDPRRFYYREAQLNGKTRPDRWAPWTRVDVQIDADLVYPVHAFGRVFVFWTKVEAVAEATTSTRINTGPKDANGNQTISSSQGASYALRIYYSFYDLNKQWVSPQLLNVDIREAALITDARLTVRNSRRWTAGAQAENHDNIQISCAYRAGSIPRYRGANLSAELYAKHSTLPAIANRGESVLSKVLKESGNGVAFWTYAAHFGVSPASVVMLNGAEYGSREYWFALDYKGGSFLCKPSITFLEQDAWPHARAERAQMPPPTGVAKTIRAAVRQSAPQRGEGAQVRPDSQSKVLYFTDTQFASGDYDKDQNWLPNKDYWGRSESNVGRGNGVDAALTRGDVLTLFSGKETLSYVAGSYAAKSDSRRNWDAYFAAEFGAPGRALAQHLDQVQWTHVDAAFTAPDGLTTYVFSRATKSFAVVSNDRWERSVSVASKWGRVRGEGNAQGRAGTLLRRVWEQAGELRLVFDTGQTENGALGGAARKNIAAFSRWPSANEKFVAALKTGYPKSLAAGEDIRAARSADRFDPARVRSMTFGESTLAASAGQRTVIALVTREGGAADDTEWVELVGSKKIQEGDFIPWHFSSMFHECKDTTTAVTASAQYVYLFCRDGVRIFDRASTAWFQTELLNRDRQSMAVEHAVAGPNGTLVLFADGQYMRTTEADLVVKVDANNNKLDGQITVDKKGNGVDGNGKAVGQVGVKNISWQSSGRVDTDFLGQMQNLIGTDGLVDGAWTTDTHLYLFSGSQYVRYSLNRFDRSLRNLDFVDEGYPKAIAGNLEDLPQWAGIGAGATMATGKTVFFTVDGKAYAEAGRGDELNDTATGWGRFDYAINRTGNIDAAYWEGDHLYAISSDELYRYGVFGDGLPDDLSKGKWFIEPGYPKKIVFGDGAQKPRINGTFTAKTAGPRYVFAGGFYYEVPAGQEPVALNEAHAITGSWIGFPDPLESGLDATLEMQDKLLLFKGDQYATFTRARALPQHEGKDPWSIPGFYEISDADYEVIRLSSGTAAGLNEMLFTGGVPGLLSVDAQRMDELPRFSKSSSDPTTIQVSDRVKRFPIGDHLDFDSANGIYYWEIFFHVPHLIAQALNTAQKFEEAKRWYEFIFDPAAKPNGAPTPGAVTENNHWYFLPFRTASNEALDESVKNQLQLATSVDDPFDPHAIAAIRNVGYRKAIVMAYVDNLLDWGDMLFRQFTRESINEARMLYILAYDLLGEKPDSPTRNLAFLSKTYRDLGRQQTEPREANKWDILHSVDDPYFQVPGNAEFGDYWTRVEDRLYKIRRSMTILGISQPLPLFEPPIDPMALVQATSAGIAVSGFAAGAATAVPHYRFSFMLRKAQELLQGVGSLGSELLGALEKKDAEEIALLQNRQEGEILQLTRFIKEAQLRAAAETIKELEASLQGAHERQGHYKRLVSEGMLPSEEAQIGLMAAGAACHFVSSGLKIAAAIGNGVPEVLVGPFIFGTMVGGQELGGALSEASEVPQGLGEGLSMTGEVLGVVAQYERSAQDWDLQLATVKHEIVQISHQLEGARLHQKIAQRELDILDKQAAHNVAVTTFMRSKFSNAQLYQWMVGKLAGLYYQSYSMAYEMAKSAEKAFQFERAVKESEVNFIRPVYWDSQKQGLLAGNCLAQDLSRMEKAYVENNSLGFEITKKISLLRLDPLALLQLKSKGQCEFALTEALFDYDFPGHYCRQVRTVALTFVAAEDRRLPVNATLTQLNHKTVLEADAKAVKYLLEPKDQPPTTLRNDWRNSQQIVLSQVEDHEANNGLFELRYDNEQYLPFEGTGAVSSWRLELSGTNGDYNIGDLQDVIVTLKYTAEQGGAVFATAVKGMLKPYSRARYFNLARDFPDAWQAFVDGESAGLDVLLTRDQFPQLHGSRLAGVFPHFELAEPGNVSLVLNGSDALTLKAGKYLPTPGLTVGKYGSQWALRVKGDVEKLANVGLVVTYTAKVA